MDLNAWDVVQLRRTDNVQWRSGPKGAAITPHGNWIIIGFIGPEALVAKDGTMVKIPVVDLKRVGVYSKDDVMRYLKEIGKPDQTIDMVDIVAREFGWDHQKARSFLLKYNLTEKASGEAHKQKILTRVHRLIQGGFNG